MVRDQHWRHCTEASGLGLCLGLYMFGITFMKKMMTLEAFSRPKIKLMKSRS